MEYKHKYLAVVLLYHDEQTKRVKLWAQNKAHVMELLYNRMGDNIRIVDIIRIM